LLDPRCWRQHDTSVATNSPEFVRIRCNRRTDYGAGLPSMCGMGGHQSTYDLPFGRSYAAHGGDGQSSGDRKLAAFSGIQTLRLACRLHAVVLQPSNEEDTRNPVRPSVNPNFTGEIIQGGPPQQVFNTDEFCAAAAGDDGNVDGGQHLCRGHARGKRSVPDKEGFRFRYRWKCSFAPKSLTCQSHELNVPNPVVLHRKQGDRRYGRSDHSHFHYSRQIQWIK